MNTLTCLMCGKNLVDITEIEGNCKKSALTSKAHVVDAKEVAKVMDEVVGMD